MGSCMFCGRRVRRGEAVCRRCEQDQDGAPLEDDYSEDSDADSVCDDDGWIADLRGNRR